MGAKPHLLRRGSSYSIFLRRATLFLLIYVNQFICLQADTKLCKILIAEKSIIKKGKSKWPLTGAGQIMVPPYIGHTAAGVLLSFEGGKKKLDQNYEKIISLCLWEKRRPASIPSSPGVLGSYGSSCSLCLQCPAAGESGLRFLSCLLALLPLISSLFTVCRHTTQTLFSDIHK